MLLQNESYSGHSPQLIEAQPQTQSQCRAEHHSFESWLLTDTSINHYQKFIPPSQALKCNSYGRIICSLTHPQNRPLLLFINKQ